MQHVVVVVVVVVVFSGTTVARLKPGTLLLSRHVQ
jgi:hypothetical protein